MSFSPQVSIFAPNGSFFRTMFYTTLITFCSSFYQAYALSYTNTAAEAFKDFIEESYKRRGSPISSSHLLWFWSLTLNCLIIGNFCGTLYTPLLTEKMGRKFTLMIGNVGMLIASLIGAISIPTSLPELFVFGRILGSAMAATNFVALSLIMTVINLYYLFNNECAATKHRGTCFFIAGVSFSAASVLGMVLGMTIFFGHHIFVIVAIGVIPTIFGCLMAIPMKESPKFLLVNRQNKIEAKKSLIFYQGHDIDHDEIMDQTLAEEEDTRSNISTLVLAKEVFCQPYLRRAVFLGICSLQLIVGVWNITTELLSAHFTSDESELYSTVLFGVNFIAGLIGVFAIARIKRRTLMLISSFLNVFALFTYVVFDRLAFSFSHTFIYACLVSMFLYNFSYGIGIGTISFYITGELLPQLHRSVGQSVVFFITLVISFLFSFLTLPAYKYYNVWAFIPLFIVPGCFCIFYIYLYLPETRNKEIHQIVQELKASTQSRETLNLTASIDVD